MTDTPLNKLEQMLDRTARAVSGGGLHPLEVMERVSRAIEEGVRDGVAPNEIRVQLHQSDFARVASSLQEFEGVLREAALEIEREKRYRRIGDLVVVVEESPRAARGSPTIVTRFVDTTSRRQPLAQPANATRRVLRHKGVSIRTSTGDRVPLLHTPFTIGRAAENDLVLPSVSVSRWHAEIVKVAEGFGIKDLGSRNGILIDGNRVEHAVFVSGVGATLGDITIWIEFPGE